MRSAIINVNIVIRGYPGKATMGWSNPKGACLDMYALDPPTRFVGAVYVIVGVFSEKFSCSVSR